MKINSIFRAVYIYSIIFFTLTFDAYAAGDDLLSIDKTIVVQFLIFIVALYILNSLFFKPLLELADRREKLTKGTVQEAKDLTEKAEQAITNYNDKIEIARSEAVEKRTEIRKEAQTAAETTISEARAESQKSLKQYKNDLNLHIDQLKETMKPEVDALARDIASRVLDKEV